MYDLGSALSAGVNAQPVRMWNEHQAIVTCLAPVPGSPHLFVSGAHCAGARIAHGGCPFGRIGLTAARARRS
jgi:hypothetical protein